MTTDELNALIENLDQQSPIDDYENAAVVGEHEGPTASLPLPPSQARTPYDALRRAVVTLSLSPAALLGQASTDFDSPSTSIPERVCVDALAPLSSSHAACADFLEPAEFLWDEDSVEVAELIKAFSEHTHADY